MSLPEHCPEIHLSATKYLDNALDFAQTKFVNVIKRNYIMKDVSDTAMSQEAEIRQAAFERLVSIASTYYGVLEPYMQTLFELTSHALKGDEVAVALQAVEFWSTLYDKEIALQDNEDSDYVDSSSSSSNFRFIEKTQSYLVPVLLATLLKQEKDQDHDNSLWNLSGACGTYLCLVATVVGDDIIPLVMPFLVDNILNPDWHCRDAASYAFGSILDSPIIGNLSPMVLVCLDILLNAMEDENNHVRDRTAWTLCRIFELLLFSITSPALQRVVGVLLESIEDTPNIADKVCKTLYYFAQGYEDNKVSCSVLSKYLPNIISGLIRTVDRTDGREMNLRSFAYVTLEEVVRWVDLPETYHISTQLLPAIKSRLDQTLKLQIISKDDREKQGALQAHLCCVLQLIIKKFSSSHDTILIILKSADELMILFLGVLGC